MYNTQLEGNICGWQTAKNDSSHLKKKSEAWHESTAEFCYKDTGVCDNLHPKIFCGNNFFFLPKF